MPRGKYDRCGKRRGHYSKLPTSKLDEILGWLQEQPEPPTTSGLMHQFLLKRSTAFKLLREWTEWKSGQELHPRRPRGPPKSDRSAMCALIARILKADCTLSMKGVVRKLRVKFQVHTSEQTIRRCLRAMNWTKKRVTRELTIRNSQEVMKERVEYAKFVAPYPNANLYFLDESGANLWTMSNYGWAPRGLQARKTVTSQRGCSVSMLVVIGYEGLRFQLFRGAVNAKRLHRFLADEFRPWVHQRGPGQRLLLLDNVRFHKTNLVRNLFPHQGTRLQYLPRYSPQLNPVEMIFHTIKAKLRNVRPHPETTSELIATLNSILTGLREDPWHAYYRNMRVWLQMAFENQRFVRSN